MMMKNFIPSVVLVLLRNALVDPGEEPEPMRFFIRFSYRPLIVKILKNPENLKKKIQDGLKKYFMFSRKEMMRFHA